MVQVVQKPTRIDQKTGKESLLDTIITTLSSYYQEPKCIAPLDVDNDKIGKKSDHQIVLMEPVNNCNPESARVQRVVKTRPITQKGLENMTTWLIDEKWTSVLTPKSAHKKAENFQDLLVEKFNLFFPKDPNIF